MDLLGPNTEFNKKVRTFVLYPVPTSDKDKWHPCETVVFNLYFYRLDLKAYLEYEDVLSFLKLGLEGFKI